MNFDEYDDEYEKKYQTRYAEFAGVVRDILEKAINGAEGVPRPQSIKSRAKEASHLKPKLGIVGYWNHPLLKTKSKISPVYG
jgi:hypothetical protein